MNKAKSAKAMIVNVLMALCTAFFIQYAIPASGRLYYTINLFPAVVAFLLFLLYSKFLFVSIDRFKDNKLQFCVTAALSLLFSFFIIEGAGVADGSFFNPVSVHLLIAIAFCSLPILIGLFLLWDLLGCTKEGEGTPVEKVAFRWYTVVFLIMVILWIPYLFATWPGIFAYDMGINWGEYRDYALNELSDHLPVLHVLWTGFIVDFGASLFGGGEEAANAGIALLTCLQILILSAIFTYSIVWMKRRGAQRWLVYGSVAYFALNPVMAMFAMCTSRDVLFSAVALLVVLSVYDAFSAQPTKKKRLTAMLRMGLSCVLLCLLRNNGPYAFVLVAIVAVALAKGKSRFPMALTCFAVIACSLVWFGPVSSALGVVKADARSETLAMPIQQLAYVADNGSLTEDEQRMLEEYGYRFPTGYSPNISDPSKSTVKSMKTVNIIKAYIAVGVNHPQEYLYAELARTQDLWNPYSYIDCYVGSTGEETSFFHHRTEAPGHMESKFPALFSLVKEIGGGLLFQRTPFVALLVSLPLCFALSLLLLGRLLMIKDRRGIAALTVLIALSITAYFGPCVLPRYYLYLFFALPTMLFLLVGSRQKIEKTSIDTCSDVQYSFHIPNSENKKKR